MDTKKLPTAPSVPANLLKVLPEQRSTVVENDCAWFIYDPHAGFLNKGKAQFGVLAREDVGIEPTDGFECRPADEQVHRRPIINGCTVSHRDVAVPSTTTARARCKHRPGYLMPERVVRGSHAWAPNRANRWVQEVGHRCA